MPSPFARALFWSVAAALTLAALEACAPASGPALPGASVQAPGAAQGPGSAQAGGAGQVARGPQGCLTCHAGVTGLEAAHVPELVPCEACHRGEPAGATPEAAHAGLVRIPGNAADVDTTCGVVGCHPEMPPRLRGSIMFTMRGVVAVDRWLFGERPTPAAAPTDPGIDALGHSPADTHLRNLCASCHLGAPKRVAGPIDEASRGGACNACHLVYPAAALAARRQPSTGPWTHPRLVATPSDIHCFGCHSRSGRIALSYAGWREAPPGPVPSGARTLADGRVLMPAPPDVHFRAGLACVDCHGSWEVMGDGRPAESREAQQTLACTDCHTAQPPTVEASGLDPETARRASRLGLTQPGPARRWIVQAKGGKALPNVFLGPGGAVTVRRKLAGEAVGDRGTGAGRDPAERTASGLLPSSDRTTPPAWRSAGDQATSTPWRSAGERTATGQVASGEQTAAGLVPTGDAVARRPAAACDRTGAHRRLDCGTCHDAWAFHCLGCHTSWDPAGTHVDLLTEAEAPGEWVERGGDVLFDPPVLGQRGVHTATGGPLARDGTPSDHVAPGGRITGFIPGMVMTLVRGPGAAPEHRRLYAPASPHTTQRAAPACADCHLSSLALGYGRGRLRLAGGRFRFTPARPLAPDGLPDDAWLPFDRRPTDGPSRPSAAALSTRVDATPLDAATRFRVLRVGACLTCHPAGSAVVARLTADLPATLAARRPPCRRALRDR